MLSMEEHLKCAIALLQQVTSNLEALVTDSEPEQSPRETVDSAKVTLQRVLAELSAAIDPPLADKIPPELLSKADRLGIPLNDIEVRVALNNCHPSQLTAILNEIEQRFEEIRRVREYLLVRLPDMPIEKMGERLPVYTAADFAWDEPKFSPAELEQLKAKYQIDRLLQQPPRHSTDLFSQIDAANQAWKELKNNNE
jgi:hypothetical protein